MVGARIEFDNADALAAIGQAIDALGDATPLFRDIGEFLLITHRQRFQDQISPDGVKWQALSPRYLRRKKKNRDKILQLDGRLKNDLAYQASEDELLFGSNRKYAAIHQFGGTIDMPARSQEVYFKQAKDGTIGKRFVEKTKSNFAQRVTIGAHKIVIPARPFLGISQKDEADILSITQKHFERALASL